METLISPAVASFQKDGYVVLEDLFSPSELAPISDETDRLIEGAVEGFAPEDVVWEPNVQPPRLRNAFRLHLRNPFYLQVARTPALVSVVEEILGSPLRLYGGQIFAKPAGVGTAVPSHQDMPYWPFAPSEMLTAWIALDDARIENGCVRMVAGSHLLGMLPHEKSNVPGNSLGIVDHPAVAALPEHPIELRRGSCVLHHCLTVHRSDPNQSPMPRRGLTYVYMSPNVQLTEPDRLKGPAIFPVVSA